MDLLTHTLQLLEARTSRSDVCPFLPLGHDVAIGTAGTVWFPEEALQIISYQTRGLHVTGNGFMSAVKGGLCLE